MKSELLNYSPQNLEYVLDENVEEMFPKELDFLSLEGESLLGEQPVMNKRDALKFVSKHFSCQFPEHELAERKLDDFEVKNIREEYCHITENDLPIRMMELEEAIEKAKKMKKDAEEALAAVRQEILAYATQVKVGNKEIRLKPKETFSISLGGYYLIYTWDENKQKFVLANAYEIDDYTEIWANDSQNRETMLQCFGYEAPEVEMPVIESEDEVQFEEEMPM